MTANVMRFLQLQDLVNDQIAQHGIADAELADELETLGDQLTNDEISMLCAHVEDREPIDDMEYEDIEDWIE